MRTRNIIAGAAVAAAIGFGAYQSAFRDQGVAISRDLDDDGIEEIVTCFDRRQARVEVWDNTLYVPLEEYVPRTIISASELNRQRQDMRLQANEVCQRRPRFNR